MTTVNKSNALEHGPATDFPTFPSIVDYADRASSYARASKAGNTRKAYASDMADFARFTRSFEAEPVPAPWQLVAAYATHMADRDLKIATIRRRMVAISQAHKSAGHASPTSNQTVRDVVAGIARTKGVPPRRKDALDAGLLRDVVLSLRGDGLKPKRDRAIVLLGFAIAGRRSEVAALNIEDLRFDERGLVVMIRESKTDQEGVGVEIGVPYVAIEGLCATRAVQEWINAAGNLVGSALSDLLHVGRTSGESDRRRGRRPPRKASCRRGRHYGGFCRPQPSRWLCDLSCGEP